MIPNILHQTWKTKDITQFAEYHKSFYDIKLNKFDLEAMNEINRKNDDYAVILTDVKNAIDKLDKYDYLQTGWKSNYNE